MSKILIYDIETSPNLGFIWGKYEQDVIEYVSEWHMLCFAYRWLGENKTHVVALPDFGLYKKDPSNDLELIKVLYSLFDEADVLIAHNGDRFDQKKSQARFIYHGMTPPSPYKQVDTLKVAKQHFSFNSNKLDDLGQHLGLGRKVTTGGFALWKGCMDGNMKAWEKMKKYNKQDVVLLEKVYKKMLPWITNHPSLALMDGRPSSCPRCGSSKIHRSGKKVYTKVSSAQRYRCYDCGGWLQDRKKENNKDIPFTT